MSDADTNAGQTEGQPADTADEEDLDSLLSAYDEHKAASDKPADDDGKLSDTDLKKALRDDLSERKKEREEKHKSAVNEGLQASVKAMRESGGTQFAGVPDILLKGAFFALGDQDPKIYAAFVDRDKNPDRWKRTIKALSKQIAKEMDAVKTIDPDATKDREAMRAAVKGSDKPPKQENEGDAVVKMTDAEFDEWERKKGFVRDFL